MADFPKIPAHVGISLAFFGGIATVFMLQMMQKDPQVIVMPPTGSVIQQQPTQQPAQQGTTGSCNTDEDCPSQTGICNEYRFCEELPSAVCTCSQPQVLQCADHQNRAKHTFCPNGCRMVDGAAQCL